MTFNHIPVDLPKLVQVNVNGKRHYECPDGNIYPSVTTILAAKPKEYLAKWKKRVGEVEAARVSAIASDRGHGHHAIIENYLNNDKFPCRGQMPTAIESFQSVKPLLNRINNIHCLETSLFSSILGAAGSLDCCGEFDEELSIIDFKTSKRMKKKEDILDYFVQCTFYSLMYQHMTDIPVKQIVIIMSINNEKPLLFVEKTRNYVPQVLEALRFYKATLTLPCPVSA